MDRFLCHGTFKSILFFYILFITLVCPTEIWAKDYDYINISNPFLKKTPVAVTEFKAFNGHDAEVVDGENARKILSDALNFTGYLKTMNPAAFLSNPAKSGIQLGQINFRDWTGIGAELLVTGGIIENNGKLTLRLRLIDTFNGRLLVGKIYTGPRKQLRKMIHLFCSEISYKLTGKWGVFRSQIAFVSKVKGNKEIFVCDFDGSNIKQITNHKSICLSPSWSSDGQWLAYVSYARKKPDIFIKNLKENRGAIVNFKGMNISASEIRKGVESGKFSGYDDASVETLASLRKRGFKAEAIVKYFYEIGPTKRDKTVEKEEVYKTLNALNRKVR